MASFSGMHLQRPRTARRTAALLLALAAVVVSGCSSSPDQPDAEMARKNQAARYTEFGNGYFQAADFEMALNFFELALQENIAVDNLPGIAKSYNSIGRVYAATENYASAEDHYRMAMEFAELADDPETVTHTLINQGELHLRRGETAEALTLFERARDRSADEDEPADPVLYHNLGTLYARNDEFDAAVDHLETARTLNEEVDDWSELASNHFMLASIASRRGNYDAARDHAIRALDYDKRAENSPGIAGDLNALGAISERQERFEEAYQYYLRSLRIYLSLNRATESVSVLDRLVVVADQLGKRDDAERFEAEQARIRELLAAEETE
ncbi:MAG: tetratricopeptide repeat protein [Spirochaeta sp.]|jgi:tetratricopeptide (TPR) repeat protein|nr:tetratricopeptide repeat protein [Spirochaeta sp.]